MTALSAPVSYRNGDSSPWVKGCPFVLLPDERQQASVLLDERVRLAWQAAKERYLRVLELCLPLNLYDLVQEEHRVRMAELVGTGLAYPPDTGCSATSYGCAYGTVPLAIDMHFPFAYLLVRKRITEDMGFVNRLLLESDVTGELVLGEKAL